MYKLIPISLLFLLFLAQKSIGQTTTYPPCETNDGYARIVRIDVSSSKTNIRMVVKAKTSGFYWAFLSGTYIVESGKQNYGKRFYLRKVSYWKIGQDTEFDLPLDTRYYIYADTQEAFELVFDPIDPYISQIDIFEPKKEGFTASYWKSMGIANGLGEPKKFRYANGVYQGPVRNEKAYGKGKFNWDNGDVYTGDFLDGYLSGTGLLVYSNGESYYGGWTRSKRDGLGKYKFSNGSYYKGQWVNDNLDGKVSLYDPQGLHIDDYIYENGKLMNKSNSSSNTPSFEDALVVLGAIAIGHAILSNSSDNSTSRSYNSAGSSNSSSNSGSPSSGSSNYSSSSGNSNSNSNRTWKWANSWQRAYDNGSKYQLSNRLVVNVNGNRKSFSVICNFDSKWGEQSISVQPCESGSGKIYYYNTNSLKIRLGGSSGTIGSASSLESSFDKIAEYHAQNYSGY